MSVDGWQLGQWGLALAVTGSLAWAAPPVIRHMLGIVVVERAATFRSDSASGAAPLELTAVLDFQPFGRAAPQVASRPEASGATLPELALHGIVAAARTDASMALISVAGAQSFYRAGDAVAAGGRLETVAVDHAVVRFGDRDITLRFEETPEVADKGSAPVAPGGSANDRLRAAVVVADRTRRNETPETTADYIAYWRQKIRKNPQEVLDTIGLEPAGEGYRIAPDHNRGVRLAGLLAGDLVRRVNGRPVGDPEEDRLAYDAIAASGQARIEVQRGDKLLTFSFPLR